jgi:hypothetical protein
VDKMFSEVLRASEIGGKTKKVVLYTQVKVHKAPGV